MMRWLAAMLIVLMALCACDDAPSGEVSRVAPAAANVKPNVVVILIDTLRPDHLPCFDYRFETAPFLSSLARGGIAFRRAYSSSTWTAPATASLFTSLYPVQHGVLEGFFVHRTRASTIEPAEPQRVSLNRLPESAPTLPELFARQGWKTFGVAANVNITGRMGFDRGFARFHDLTGLEYGKGGAADLVLTQLRLWKSELDAEPYFLYLHLNDVHSPWRDRTGIANGPEDLPTKNRMAYDGEIRFVDNVLAQAYTEFGWSKNTLVCVVSDHGEEFMEHGQTGHNFSVYRELLQIVWFLSWPERWRKGRAIDDNAGIVDVFPTLLELCGMPFVPGLEGRSLVPLIESNEKLAPRALFAHRVDLGAQKDLWAVVRGEWKLIVGGAEPELYHTLRDPLEKLNLAAERAELVAELQRELEQFRARAKPVGNVAVDVQLNAADVENLRGLGYTDGHK